MGWQERREAKQARRQELLQKVEIDIATSPDTSGEVLARMASVEPALWPHIAANPSAPPGLLEEMAGHDPALWPVIAANPVASRALAEKIAALDVEPGPYTRTSASASPAAPPPPPPVTYAGPPPPSAQGPSSWRWAAVLGGLVLVVAIGLGAFLGLRSSAVDQDPIFEPEVQTAPTLGIGPAPEIDDAGSTDVADTANSPEPAFGASVVEGNGPVAPVILPNAGLLMRLSDGLLTSELRPYRDYTNPSPTTFCGQPLMESHNGYILSGDEYLLVGESGTGSREELREAIESTSSLREGCVESDEGRDATATDIVLHIGDEVDVLEVRWDGRGIATFVLADDERAVHLAYYKVGGSTAEMDRHLDEILDAIARSD